MLLSDVGHVGLWALPRAADLQMEVYSQDAARL